MTRLTSGFFISFITLFIFNFKLTHSQRFYRDLREHKNWPLLDRGTFCGRRLEAGHRIMGGKNADPNEFPFVVSPMIVGSVPQESGFPLLEAQICGGSVINNRYVLTAAHCCALANKKITSTIYVVKRSGVQGVYPPPELLPVDKVTIHNDYNVYTWQNDICLMRLMYPLEFSKNFQPICLPIGPEWENVDLTGLNMTVAGWGLKYDEPTTRFKMADRLQKIEVTVISPWCCIWQWRNTMSPVQVNPQTQLCAGAGMIHKDACEGDSGGPLMYKNTLDGPTRYFLVGLVSFGSRCELNKTPEPGVYVKVSYYMSWILDNIYE